MPGLDFFRS